MSARLSSATVPTAPRQPSGTAAPPRCGRGRGWGRPGRPAVLALLAACLALGGCSALVRVAGARAVTVVEEQVTPANLTLGDVDMACSYALTALPLLDAGRRAGADAALVESVLLMLGGACADARAQEEELRHLRAFRARRFEEADDARTSKKRWSQLAAQRQQASFERLRGAVEARGGPRYGRDCPSFRRDFEEFAFLIGSIAGAQAVLNAADSPQGAGAVLDIPPRVDAAMRCLDSAKWWGAPEALRAVVHGITPTGGGRDERLARFARAMDIGERRGVRIAHVMAAISATATGDEATLRAVIRRFAALPPSAVNVPYRMVDAVAEAYLLSDSDRLWTRATGARTPPASLGRFWDDAAPAAVDVDALLK